MILCFCRVHYHNEIKRMSNIQWATILIIVINSIGIDWLAQKHT